MKLKKYNQFVKNINEDIDPRMEEFDMNPRTEVEPIGDKFDRPEDLDQEIAGELPEDDFDSSDDDDDYQPEVVDITDGELPPQEGEFPEYSEEEEEEEEGHEYKGSQLMQDLASKLGSEVVNNQIHYNGQTINYYSETEKFHIGRQKFDTVEEVLDFLGGGVESPVNREEIDQPIDLDEVPQDVEMQELGESRKYIRRFK